MSSSSSSKQSKSSTNGGKSRASSKNGNNDEQHFNNKANNEASLEAAFVYFEIDNPQDATWETIKKNYRRLSLIHHPDRNKQSEESKKEMQKVNRFFELLEQEFERREGGNFATNFRVRKPTAQTTQNPSTTNTDTGRNAEPKPRDPNDPFEAGISREEYKRRRNLKKKQWQQAEKKAKTTRRFNYRMMREQKLQTASGRALAFRAWQREVDQIKDLRGEGKAMRNRKPRNPLMDYSIDAVAMELKRGDTLVAKNLFCKSIGDCMARRIEIMIFGKVIGKLETTPDLKYIIHSWNGETCHIMKEKVVKAREGAYAEVLASPRDQDGNHVLFYAVYHDDNDMLTYLTTLAREANIFSQYITSTNCRGSTILDFCVGSSDAAFKKRVQALYEEGLKEQA